MIESFIIILEYSSFCFRTLLVGQLSYKDTIYYEVF